MNVNNHINQVNDSGQFPRVTFGIIVLNGEPFTRYNLRALYSFAYEIIVVEGASKKAGMVASLDGHSIDGTLEVLRDFKRNEDPENKIIIVTAEDCGHPDGFWPGDKDQQSQAYAERATGDYLWQIDIDEFYKQSDIESILKILIKDTSISQVNFYWLNFWGSFNYLVDGLYIHQHYRHLHGGVPRLFKWGEGYQYITHRPPTVINDQGLDVRIMGKHISGKYLSRKGIYCYHYGSCFIEQVQRKGAYYEEMGWTNPGEMKEWSQRFANGLFMPFRIEGASGDLSWLKRFTGNHPKHIQMMISHIESLHANATFRDDSDIENLLRAKRYILGIRVIRMLLPILLWLNRSLPRIGWRAERVIEKIFTPSNFK